MECLECKIVAFNPANPKRYSCTICHANPKRTITPEISGYWYKDQACLHVIPPEIIKLADPVLLHVPGQAYIYQTTDVINSHENGFKELQIVCLIVTSDYNSSLNPKIHILLWDFQLI